MAPVLAGSSAVGARVVALLLPLTPFAEAIVKRQAERAGLSLATLTEADLKILGPMIVSAAAVFVDPDALLTLKRQLGR